MRDVQETNPDPEKHPSRVGKKVAYGHVLGVEEDFYIVHLETDTSGRTLRIPKRSVVAGLSVRDVVQLREIQTPTGELEYKVVIQPEPELTPEDRTYLDNLMEEEYERLTKERKKGDD